MALNEGIINRARRTITTRTRDLGAMANTVTFYHLIKGHSGSSLPFVLIYIEMLVVSQSVLNVVINVLISHNISADMCVYCVCVCFCMSHCNSSAGKSRDITLHN